MEKNEKLSHLKIGLIIFPIITIISILYMNKIIPKTEINIQTNINKLEFKNNLFNSQEISLSKPMKFITIKYNYPYLILFDKYEFYLDNSNVFELEEKEIINKITIIKKY